MGVGSHLTFEAAAPLIILIFVRTTLDHILIEGAAHKIELKKNGVQLQALQIGFMHKK
jgi:hypothetical protein